MLNTDPFYNVDHIRLKIEEVIITICTNILKKGNKTTFNEIFDYLYEYIEDNLEKFLLEADDGEL